jgi:hypothetical protein
MMYIDDLLKQRDEKIRRVEKEKSDLHKMTINAHGAYVWKDRNDNIIHANDGKIE